MGRVNHKKLVITIDGPAGSGKSTVGKIISQKLKLKHLSSGKIYRTIALLQMKYGLDEALTLADKIILGKGGEIILDGKSLDEEISSEEVGKKASDISMLPVVRKKANEIQRKIVYENEGGFVVDGRDEGTSVFAEAQIKIFLDASPTERARRRFLEQKGKSYEQMLKMIIRRDEQDKEREISPLRIPEDAVYIDSTGKSIDEVVEIILDVIRKRIPEILHCAIGDSK